MQYFDNEGECFIKGSKEKIFLVGCRAVVASKSVLPRCNNLLKSACVVRQFS